jgi:hypothetical protein
VEENFITESANLDRLILAYAGNFPKDSDFKGYRSHCLRILNVILRVSDDEPDRREKLDIALAFHDITVFPNRTLDYLKTSTELACEHLRSINREEWEEEISLMIDMHHKITPYKGVYANLVEAMRKADWVDVSFGVFSFGLERTWLTQLNALLPLHTLYPRTLSSVIFQYVLRHPFKPLPNLKW